MTTSAEAPFREMLLTIEGLGFLLYSPFAVEHIPPGRDYLRAHFSAAADVAASATSGKLVGVGTGSPGDFVLRFFDGYPDEEKLLESQFRLRLALEVRDDVFCVRDLYDLLEWDPACPALQQVAVDSGFYHVTLCSWMPNSGVLGDMQRIDVHMSSLPQLPTVRYDGVPTLCC